MAEARTKRFRFLLVSAFSLTERAAYQPRPRSGPKEALLYNHAEIAHLLEDVEWELHPGAPTSHGDWPVELREEFAITGVNRLPIVREACASGRYDAVVLLGGGDPGFWEAREIGHRHGVPVTACAHAQMHIAGMLGTRFSVIDISEVHNMQMADLVRRYAMTERCASIRNIDHPLPRPSAAGRNTLNGEQEKAARGETSSMLEAAVAESVAAIEEDGAEVLILGCSGAYWLQPHLQRRLGALGWDIPVLEGYRCAIEMAKTLVNLRVDVSGLAFPKDPPARLRRRKFV
jgi:allantoin racemase